MPAPCQHNPPMLPPAGIPWTDAYCHLCHLYATSEFHRRLFDNWPERPKAFKRQAACISLGAVVARSPGICRRLDTRRCELGHGEVTQARECETCADYEAEEP